MTSPIYALLKSINVSRGKAFTKDNMDKLRKMVKVVLIFQSNRQKEKIFHKTTDKKMRKDVWIQLIVV